MKHKILSLVQRLVLSVFCAGIMLTGSSYADAQAPCSRWDLNGEWRFIQSNQEDSLFTLTVTPDGIQGSAKYWTVRINDNLFGENHRYWQPGSVDGVINGNSIELIVYWHSTPPVSIRARSLLRAHCRYHLSKAGSPK
jgi:hypothetical protein